MTSATGRWKTDRVPAQVRASQGFSLLELLVVLVVIGVMISIASLSFSNFDDRPAEKAIERLRYNVGLLANESIIRSEPLAFSFSEQGYAFFKTDDEGKWVAIDDDRMLKPQKLDESLQANLLVQEEEVSLPAEVGDEPQVFVYPTGEMTPFEFTLQQKDQPPERVQFDAMGQVVKHDEG